MARYAATIICGIGTAHKDDLARIEELKNIGESVIVSMKNEKAPTFPGFEQVAHGRTKPKEEDTSQPQASILHLEEEKRIHKGVEDIFGKVFDQLNLFDSINTGYKKTESNEIFKQVVLQRVASPASKRQSVRELDVDKGKEFDLDKVYRMMDKAHENIDEIKDTIAASTKDLLSGSVDVAFFDVTTLYFESFQPDDLRVSGYSKDGKFKETLDFARPDNYNSKAYLLDMSCFREIVTKATLLLQQFQTLKS